MIPINLCIIPVYRECLYVYQYQYMLHHSRNNSSLDDDADGDAVEQREHFSWLLLAKDHRTCPGSCLNKRTRVHYSNFYTVLVVNKSYRLLLPAPT